MKYYVRPVWDNEAQCFYSESNIVGLHIEADNEEAFRIIAEDVIPDLLEANHSQKNTNKKKGKNTSEWSICYNEPSVRVNAKSMA